MHALITPLLVTLFGLISVVGVPGFTASRADRADTPESETTRLGPLDEARATLESGNGVIAATQLVRCLGDDPGNAEAWLLLGHAYRGLGMADEADAAFARALELAPEHKGALLARGELSLSMGRLESARATLARLTGLCGGPTAEAATLARAMDAQLAEV